MSRYTSKHTGPVIDAAVDTVNNGVAPAGYGLGVEMSNDYAIADCNDARACGWYVSRGAANTPPEITHGVLEASSRDGENFKMQTFKSALTNGAVVECVRTNDGKGGWNEWEFVNPPMKVDVEYRTTERYLGKPVHARVVNFGALPNATSKDLDISSYGISNIVYKNGEVLSGGYSIPFIDGSGVDEIKMNVTPYMIRIWARSNLSNRAAYVTIKYTKTTD